MRLATATASSALPASAPSGTRMPATERTRLESHSGCAPLPSFGMPANGADFGATRERASERPYEVYSVIARSMRSDEREKTAGLSLIACMISGASCQVSPSATMTLGFGDTWQLAPDI